MKRLCVALALLGALSVGSLLLAPLETLIPPEMGQTIPRALLVIQPLPLVLGGVALGCWAAPKLGLDAPIIRGLVNRTAAGVTIKGILLPALVSGLTVASVLLGYDALTASTFGNAADPMVAKMANFQVPLASKLLYGGIGEELLARWGLMSFFAFMALKLGLLHGRSLWAGNIIAALLFGLGHLPLLYLLFPSPPLWLVVTVIAGNVVPGLIFGWLFFRKGLESAMVAHGLGHLFFTMLS